MYREIGEVKWLGSVRYPEVAYGSLLRPKALNNCLTAFFAAYMLLPYRTVHTSFF